VETPRIQPPELFDLDLANLADVYGSFGNEELWAAPPAFTEDLAPESGDEDEEDDE
jgi:hypothetical protein